MTKILLFLTCAGLALAGSAAAQTASTTPIQTSTAAATIAPTPPTPPSPPTPPAAPEAQPSTTPGEAWHPGTRNWHKDCDGDVQRLCPGLTTREQVEQCLSRNEAQLSPACKQLREKEGHRH